MLKMLIHETEEYTCSLEGGREEAEDTDPSGQGEDEGQGMEKRLLYFCLYAF